MILSVEEAIEKGEPVVVNLLVRHDGSDRLCDGMAKAAEELRKHGFMVQEDRVLREAREVATDIHILGLCVYKKGASFDEIEKPSIAAIRQALEAIHAPYVMLSEPHDEELVEACKALNLAKTERSILDMAAGSGKKGSKPKAPL